MSNRGRVGSAVATHAADAGTLPADVLRAVEGAMANRTGGAWPVHVAPWKLKGRAVAALYLAGAAPHVMRDALEVAWVQAGRTVMAALGTDLVPAFRYAAFPVPARLPDLVPCWRATRGLRLEQASAGHAWSTHRGATAAWLYELKVEGVKGVPLLIRCEVPRTEILFCPDDNRQREVFLAGGPGAVVCGTPAEWHAAAVKFIGVGYHFDYSLD